MGKGKEIESGGQNRVGSLSSDKIYVGRGERRGREGRTDEGEGEDGLVRRRN